MTASVLPSSPAAFAKATWDEVIPYFDDLLERPLDASTVDEWLSAWSRLEELVTEAAAQAMIDAGNPGAILTVSSVNALRSGTVDYSTSKAGVVLLALLGAGVLLASGSRTWVTGTVNDAVLGASRISGTVQGLCQVFDFVHRTTSYLSELVACIMNSIRST